MTQSPSLLRRIRILRNHVETVAAGCRIIEDELHRAALLECPEDAAKIERAVKRIETRLMQAAQEIGIHAPKPTHGTDRRR